MKLLRKTYLSAMIQFFLPTTKVMNVNGRKEAKHYYTYSDEKRKVFAKISSNFTNLDKIQQTIGFFCKQVHVNPNRKEILR
jgi:hypothetical protein